MTQDRSVSAREETVWASRISLKHENTFQSPLVPAFDTVSLSEIRDASQSELLVRLQEAQAPSVCSPLPKTETSPAPSKSAAIIFKHQRPSDSNPQRAPVISELDVFPRASLSRAKTVFIIASKCVGGGAALSLF